MSMDYDMRGFPEPTPEDLAAYEADMAGMPQEEPDVDGMYSDMRDEKLNGRASTLPDAVDFVEAARLGKMTKEEAAAKANDSVTMDLAALDEMRILWDETREADLEVYEAHGVPYGTQVDQLRYEGLSASVTEGESMDERVIRENKDYQKYLGETLETAAQARLTAKQSFGQEFELFDESTMKDLRASGYDGVETAMKATLEAAEARDRQMLEEQERAAQTQLGAKRITFDAAKPAEQSVDRQTVEKVMTKAAEQPSKQQRRTPDISGIEHDGPSAGNRPGPSYGD